VNVFELLLFILKYTPFWAVPCGLISFHFAYLYWLKDYREIAYFWIAAILFCLTAIALYLALGGPHGATLFFTQNFN
jgi:hypothetical protein